MVFRRFLIAFVTAIIVASSYPSHVLALDTVFFRIGTGGVTGTYYKVGGLIADAISNPPGSFPCERGGDCGVPGLIAITQTSGGSIANIKAITSGDLESGFAQSDTSFAALNGEGVFEGDPRPEQLRSIAALFHEQLQLVARKDSGVAGVHDLKGKRVALDTEDSGTIIVARLVLDAYGLSETDIEPYYIKSGEAAGLMALNELDAFFIMAGAPTPSVEEALSRAEGELIPINGTAADHVVDQNPSYERTTIEAYGGTNTIETIAVRALWLVNADVPDPLVYEITKALFNADTSILMSTLPENLQITLQTAATESVVPFHPGAQRYYDEVLDVPATD